MNIYNSLADITSDAKEQLLIIGNFDGLHLGHKALIEYAKATAKDMGVSVALLTFEPHPRRLFRPDDPPFRITPYDLKMQKLQDMGIDHVISLPFDWEFASQTAEDFINVILKEGLSAKHIIVGKDFCFGQLRKGTPQMMIDAKLSVSEFETQNNNNGQKFSSSDIRRLLRSGNIQDANNMLGWDWEIRGIVQKGDQRGRELGYPTANVSLNDTLHPAYGIYACFVQIEGEDDWCPAATNIGIRPMFEVDVGQVEAHILEGFDRDIYDKMLRIRPVKKLRGEAKFDSLNALCEQMDKDCQKSLEILNIKKAA